MSGLVGRAVAVTRDGDPDDRLVELLEAAGARVVLWPTLQVVPPTDSGPLHRAAARIGEYDWVVFTSARAVDALGDVSAEQKAGARVAAVGAATAAAASGAGWHVVVEGDEGASGLVSRLLEAHGAEGAEMLFPAASLAGETLEEELEAAGARVDRVEAYQTALHPPASEDVRRDLARGVDFVTFASPSAARALAEALGGSLRELGASTLLVAIGPTTEAALLELGARDVRVASQPSFEAVVEACATAPEAAER